MAAERIVLVAASGLARETLVAIRAAGEYDVAGILDDDQSLHGSVIDGARVLAGIDGAGWLDNVRPLVCVGLGRGREKVVSRLDRQGIPQSQYATIVDPSVRVPDNCSVGYGSILLAGVVLTTCVNLGRHVVAMPQTTFTHDDVVDDYATFAAGVSLGGGVEIARGAYLGMNSSVRQKVRVGEGSTLGMGSVLLQDLPPGEIWAGVPARSLPGPHRLFDELTLAHSKEAS
ncbi:NeuD/PglB/VioB family sugar acetyltransferase [Crystallibacter degradans]|uniref:NeuD/PglB/VioB family sugar acetyltransferase n=1 Tax=Crystallibacter degradans TaxID=2726743 RepID=UPI001474C695|nr:NeuD/PglB/VioB family sugar acetyltransferase [Arthrobacter sp. SF27]NMR28219.1 acetyltransferase [Arthrobacter sp. SF27]